MAKRPWPQTLWSNEDGAILPLFAISSVLLLSVVGAAVDYNAASTKKVQLQNALDAAVLSAARDIGPSTTQSQMETAITRLVRSQVSFANDVNLTVSFDSNARSVEATGTVSHQTALLGIVGITTIPIGATSSSKVGRAYLEVALVLDNSGSMAGSRITTLRSSAVDLTQKVLGAAYLPGDTRIAVVPFASMVNVGPQNANASWIDTQGQSPIHQENFATNTRRLQLYSQMNGVSWAGCVESRPSPHDVTDTAPTSGNPATLFVPSFAPDEPDEGTSANFYNNYLSDGSCQSGLGTTPLARQRRVCKYNNSTPDQSLANGTRRGPNHMCDANPIIPLTHVQSTLNTALNAMPAYGGTNLHESLMWGWRTLSPEPPFTEGRPYNDPDNRKFIVLMTDGENDAIGMQNMNGSFYSAYGYSAAGRLGTTSNNRADIVAKMNEKTAQACNNIKATGIKIYTVAFYVTNPVALALLAECASTPAMALVANSDQDLVGAFNEIASQITRLRLTR